MKSTALPTAIDEFFRKTEHVLSERHQPKWLLSEFDAVTWVIDGGRNGRKVSGVLKGYTRLSWSRRLTEGKLTDPCYSFVLEQAKMIMVWAFDGAIPKFDGGLKTIYAFHLFLFRVIEFLDYRYKQDFRALGFELLTAEDVIEMLELTVESGFCGTGFFIERWEFFLAERVGANADHMRKMSFLKESNAFDSRGNVSAVFIGNSIGADAHRLARSQYFKEYLSIFSTSNDDVSSRPIKVKTVSQLANWFGALSHVLSVAPVKTSPDFDDPFSLNESLKPFRGMAIERTRTIPFRVAQALIGGCCSWMSDVFPDLDQFVDKVVRGALHIRSLNPRISEYSAIKAAESYVDIPNCLAQTKSYFLGGKLPKLSQHPLAPPVTLKFIHLQLAVSFVMITLLSCSRRAEVIELTGEDIINRSGRYYLDVFLRKTGLDFSRDKIVKPVPKILDEAIKQIEKLKSTLKMLYKSDDSLFHSRIFFKLSQVGVSPMGASDIYIPLRELSGCLGLKDSSGNDWTVLPHQLRRFFAISFFHCAGAENSLPALSWFMGHKDLGGTWRYIKESLTGREISASEAAMAASAVCSNDSSEGARKLREVLYEHFGCSNLSLMNEEDIQDYLEMLSERGVYSATPIQICSGKQKRVSVLITIKEGSDASFG